MPNDTEESSDLNAISQEEKKQLKKRIFYSIKELNRKRRIKKISGIAASIAFILSVGIYWSNQSHNSSIIDFVNNSDSVDFSNSNHVTIMLGEGEDVTVKGDNTLITYSKSGQEVSVNKEHTLKQEATSGKENAVKFNSLIVPYGKRSTISLSDGTKVWLNSGSKLVYPIAFKGDKREVYLEGEAAFDVTHNKKHPFKVLSKNQEIEVLGTVFNVSSYPDDNNNFVVLKSGSVEVSFNNKESLFSISNSKKLLIKPGTKANLNLQSKLVTSEEVNVDHYFSWRDGILILQKNTLEHIMRRVSRYYNVKIKIENENLANETFSGYLDLKDNIDEVVKIIKESTNINYTNTENGIITLK